MISSIILESLCLKFQYTTTDITLIINGIKNTHAKIRVFKSECPHRYKIAVIKTMINRAKIISFANLFL